MAMQSCMNMDNSRGLSMAPWGTPVLIQCGGGGRAHQHSLQSARQEVQDPDRIQSAESLRFVTSLEAQWW